LGIEKRQRMNKEQLQKRTKEFAHRCIKLCAVLPKTVLGQHVAKQLIRCSTSVAANYRAVCMAQSRATFISKLAIAIEEVDESCFWIEFLSDENLVERKKVTPLLKEGQELTAILIASQNTAKRNR
jgi:four helix bundle protein